MAKSKNNQSGESLTNSLINAANSQGEAKETPKQEPAKPEDDENEDPEGPTGTDWQASAIFEEQRADAAEKRIDMLENLIAEKDEEIKALKDENEALSNEIKKASEKAPEPIETKSEPGLEALYGKAFVIAQKGGSEKIFTRATWNLLGKDKGGWLPVVETPPEAQGL